MIANVALVIMFIAMIVIIARTSPRKHHILTEIWCVGNWSNYWNVNNKLEHVPRVGYKIFVNNKKMHKHCTVVEVEFCVDAPRYMPRVRIKVVEDK